MSNVMKTALIIGASGGIGAAMVQALEAEGVTVTCLSRRDHGFDVTSESSVARHMGHLVGPFDLIFVATGALEIEGAMPEKTIRALNPDAMMEQFRLNTVGPALVLKHAIGLLNRNAPAVIAVLSARVGSIGDNRLGGWISYRSAKAAVNQVVHTAAIEFSRTHPQLACVALHPGTVQTGFTEKYQARHPTVSPNQAAQNLLAVIRSLSAQDTGKFYDWAGKEVPW